MPTSPSVPGGTEPQAAPHRKREKKEEKKRREDIIHRQREATAAKRADREANTQGEGESCTTKLLLGRYTTLSQTR
jgi:hypothetical protein